MSNEVTASAVFRAALDLQSICEAQGWQFCIIGGIAVERWSVPRFTEDADMTVLTRFDDEPVLDALLGRFAARRPDAREFALRTRVVLLRHENEVEMDVALGALDFEARAIERGSPWQARPGVQLFTCSAEDLLVYKAFASREQDWVDVGNILAVQRERLNCEQILDELRPLAELKEDSGIVPRLEALMQKHGLRG